MPNHKSEDYKLSAVDYYLTEDKSQEEEYQQKSMKIYLREHITEMLYM